MISKLLLPTSPRSLAAFAVRRDSRAWSKRLPVSVHKGLGRLVSVDGVCIGEGRAYLHLRMPETQRQLVQGTLSLDWWDNDWQGRDARLELVDGPVLALELQTDKISACINGRVLRYQSVWPGVGPSE